MKDWLTEEQIATMSKPEMKKYIKAKLSIWGMANG
jgi:hypothetical protein